MLSFDLNNSCNFATKIHSTLLKWTIWEQLIQVFRRLINRIFIVEYLNVRLVKLYWKIRLGKWPNMLNLKGTMTLDEIWRKHYEVNISAYSLNNRSFLTYFSTSNAFTSFLFSLHLYYKSHKFVLFSKVFIHILSELFFFAEHKLKTNIIWVTDLSNNLKK